MSKARILEGVALPMPTVNIDTDMIIPKEYLKTTTRKGLARGLFAHVRYGEDGTPDIDFILNRPGYEKSTIIVAGDNFGCGSSREHAPWALRDYGINCIISTSFADIFEANCSKNGILLIAVGSDDHKQLLDAASLGPNSVFRIDVERQEISTALGIKVNFQLTASARRSMLVNVDEIESTLALSDTIERFERRYAVNRPWTN